MKETTEELKLEELLQPTGYGMTYYEVLGLNVGPDKEEIEKNYQHIKRFMQKYNQHFKEEEINLVEEAHNVLNSFLSSAWYEKDIGSKGMKNTNQQYNAKIDNLKMFKKLKQNIGKYVTVNYIEIDENTITDNKLYDKLKNSDDFLSVEFENCFNIEFLGKTTAIIDIKDHDGNIIYQNKYLQNPKLRYKYNKNTMEIFRQTAWSYYISEQLKVLDLEKEKVENIFETIENNIEKKVIVDYLENVDGTMINNKIPGILTNINKYDDITIDENFDIPFFGEDKTIIKIIDNNNNILYQNNYLLDDKNWNNYNATTKNKIREECLGYIINKNIEYQNNKTLEKSSKRYIKKI